MNTKEVANITGISVRTLHHYDEIGLLKPNRNNENGYREYSNEDLDLLQQILFFRECGFPLHQIQMLMSSPSFDREQAFLLQEKYLLHEQQRIETMLETLRKSMKSMKGNITMTSEEKFNGFDMKNNPYEEEARKLWGDDAVNKSNQHMSSLSTKDQEAIARQMDELFEKLASVRMEDPHSEKVQKEIDKMFQFFNNSFGYTYTLEGFAGLGQVYVTDERFTKNIDKYGKGLSEFLAKAMGIYAEENEVKGE